VLRKRGPFGCAFPISATQEDNLCGVLRLWS
jgi:hypothetical protein